MLHVCLILPSFLPSKQASFKPLLLVVSSPCSPHLFACLASHALPSPPSSSSLSSLVVLLEHSDSSSLLFVCVFVLITGRGRLSRPVQRDTQLLAVAVARQKERRRRVSQPRKPTSIWPKQKPCRSSSVLLLPSSLLLGGPCARSSPSGRGCFQRLDLG